jgi:hypothetical protein
MSRPYTRPFTIVTQDHWFVSTSFPVYDKDYNVPNPDAVQLSVRSHRYGESKSKELRGYGDGKVFPSQEAADRWCLDHGYTQRYYRGVWCPIHRCLHFFLGSRTPGDHKCHLRGGESYDWKRPQSCRLPYDHPAVRRRAA